MFIATAAAIYCLGHGLCTFTAAYVLSNNNNGDGGCKVCRVYAETCQASGGSGRRSWQKISQRRRAAAKKAGQNAYATCIQSFFMIMI